ncbi:hypothetical protein GT347_12520 [Xylophilus rhododendri]|uniref:Uncharacterized protein n=1 Tax=Xylophilus rhododendri TaxID=2697032 RepID=A0A857J6S9_9BURK|nr:hypothetical protein [Xylophilus rhododendri]QHI98741.1 hypothetical protein GT347_12520 [Xylophilus rhododendri]
MLPVLSARSSSSSSSSAASASTVVSRAASPGPDSQALVSFLPVGSLAWLMAYGLEDADLGQYQVFAPTAQDAPDVQQAWEQACRAHGVVASPVQPPLEAEAPRQRQAPPDPESAALFLQVWQDCVKRFRSAWDVEPPHAELTPDVLRRAMKQELLVNYLFDAPIDEAVAQCANGSRAFVATWSALDFFGAPAAAIEVTLINLYQTALNELAARALDSQAPLDTCRTVAAELHRAIELVLHRLYLLKPDGERPPSLFGAGTEGEFA